MISQPSPHPPPRLIGQTQCDVRMDGAERRLITSPLFLCPKAVNVTAGVINVNSIVSLVAVAKGQKIIPITDSLGRQAIDNVVNCRPTQLAKVVNVCNIINFILHQRGLSNFIEAGDIVACVFRIKGFGKIMEGLSKIDKAITASSPNLPSSATNFDQKIATIAKLDVAFINTLAKNYRLNFVLSHQIYTALQDYVRALPAEEGAEIREKFRGKLSSILVIDDAQRLNIEKIKEDERGSDVYLLDDSNVVPAPTTGHPWAIA